MSVGGVLALAGGGIAVIGSILIGTGQVASKEELNKVEVITSENRSDVHTLKTEQAVMKRDSAHIRGAVETLRTSQDANFQVVIEKLEEMKPPKRRRR